MNIILSENLSYCMGVKRTLNMTQKLLDTSPGITFYMLGEIVHNEYVIRDLKDRGLIFISDIREINTPGTVIIQSHGASKKVFGELKKKKIPYIDATCPMVKVIHRRIIELEKEGYVPLIIGRKGHDEVRGIQGQVSNSLVAGSEEEITDTLVKGLNKIGVVVQSTFIYEDARKIVARLKESVPEVKFVNTICQPTSQRQDEIQRQSQLHDVVLIIGSKTSANTRHLFRLARNGKSRVYLVDQPERVAALDIPVDGSVFIASGASTPQYLIEEVIVFLKKMESELPDG
jgi:4-hydroxy-3-methylbut-2-enyl diphosphate reductase